MKVTGIDIAFSKGGVNAKIKEPGHAFTLGGVEDFQEVLQEEAVGNLFLEKNTGVLMLKPILELADSALADWDTSGDPAKFEARKMPGSYYKNVVYQYNAASGLWTAGRVNKFEKDKGVILYFAKLQWNIAAGSYGMRWYIESPESGAAAGEGYYIDVYPRGEIEVAIESGAGSFTLGTIPYPVTPMDSNAGISVLSIGYLPINDYLVVFTGGDLSNAVAFKITKEYFPDMDYDIDCFDRKYLRIMKAGRAEILNGLGCCFFAMQEIDFEAAGTAVSRKIAPGYKPSSFHTDFNYLCPGTLSTASVDLDKWSEEGEGTNYKYDYRLALFSTGVPYTPFIYGYQLWCDVVRENVGGAAHNLTGDVIKYFEKQSIDSDGGILPTMALATICCYEDNHMAEWLLNAKATINIGPYDSLTKRGVFYSDNLTYNRPDYNSEVVRITFIDTIKRLQNCLVLHAKKFDGAKHTVVMQTLADRAGVTIDMDLGSGGSGDELVLGDILVEPPRWKFAPMVTIWECMCAIRRYTGWRLYVDRDGVLQYKRIPSETDVALSYTFSDKPTGSQIAVSNIIYGEKDILRTRILVLGSAAENRNSATDPYAINWDYTGEKYSKYDTIAALHINSDLETSLGESRMAVYMDPALGSYAEVAWMCNNLARWYTSSKKFVSFSVPVADDILSMNVWDKIRIIDNKCSDMSGYYFINSYWLWATQHQRWATIQGREFFTL